MYRKKRRTPAGQDKSGLRPTLATAVEAQYSEIKTSEITKLTNTSDNDQEEVMYQKEIMDLKDNHEHEET